MRKAFTLIELIFVIVIIGLLAAVAVPKFLNLKQHAEVNNVVKTTVDAAQQAAEAAVNYLDLENNNSITLQDLVKLDGKGWTYVTPSDMNGSYEYNDSTSGNLISEVNFSVDNREVNYSINCNNFSDKKSQQKCAELLDTDDNTTTVHLTF
jgi:prepilin-type N-terminal cleavage/methylation domain-containing protein